jgi:hypothetical protein
MEYSTEQWNELSKYSDSNHWHIIVREMEYAITDLFTDAVKTIYVCEFSENNEIDFNINLNLLLLQWVRQKDFEFYFE